jgi:nucleotide-binding universal stress UspA family protein
LQLAHSLVVVAVHVLVAPPMRGSETLQAFCEETDPAIVVIGSLARRGINGKLIGNTAEKLLDIVVADLLIVN